MKQKWTRALALVCTLALALALAVPGFAGGEPLEITAPEGFVYGEFMQGTEEGSDYEWKLDEDGTLTIRGTRMWIEEPFYTPWQFFSEEISSVIIEQGVQSIGEGAFYVCNAASVIIPSSVTDIGNAAFSRRSNLERIEVDAANPNYCSENGILYNKDKTLLLHVPKGIEGGLIIPSGVTSIDDDTFRRCRSLTSVTIPNGVTSIGRSAFGSCESLKSVTIPSSVTSIGDSAFYECIGLTGSLTLPSSVTSIGESAFDGCYNLTSITIPESVKSIGNDAFSSGIVGATHYFGGAGYICERKILFKGNAPQFEAGEDFGEALHFGYIAATVYYPQNDDTWTEAVRQQYGGTLTWVAYDPANPPDMSPESPAPPKAPETPAQPEQSAQPETPIQPEQSAQPETPIQPEQSAQPEAPANAAVNGKTVDALADQVLAGGDYELARQLLQTLLEDQEIPVSAHISEAIRAAIEANGGIPHGHQASESVYVYALYPENFSEALQLARAGVNAAANSFTLEMSFPENKQSPLGVYMTVYLKEAFDPALEYLWYCDDGSTGAVNLAVCDHDGYKTCATFYAPHFSTYTVRPADGANAPVSTGTAEQPLPRQTATEPNEPLTVVPVHVPVFIFAGLFLLVAAAILVCASLNKKKSHTL